MIKNFLVVVLLTLLPFLLMAQGTGYRHVRGRVVVAGGKPLTDVLIRSDADSKVFRPNADGSFEIDINSQSSYLTVSKPYYKSITHEIDGSYMVFTLVYDAKAEKERLEKIAAEKKAKQDSIAAVEKARQAAIAAAERERLTILEKAKHDSLTAARELKRQERTNEYKVKYKNRGFEHRVSVAYMYPVETSSVMYKYSGYREYESLYPIAFDYSFHYRFNRLFSVGAGAGITYNLKSCEIINDLYNEDYYFKEQRIDVPLFATINVTPLKTRVRPSLGVSVGYYIIDQFILYELSAGIECRINKKMRLELAGLINDIPIPTFREYAYYMTSNAYGVRLAFIF